MKTRAPMTLSFTTDTKERLKAYAEQTHRTVSQAITDWIWAQPVRQAAQGAGEDTAGTEAVGNDG